MAQNLLLESLNELPLRHFEPGEIVIEKGANSGQLYFLANGSVEVSKNDVEIGKVSEIGAVFGEMALLLYSQHTATVRADKPCDFYVVEKPKEFLITHPEVAVYIGEVLATRLNYINNCLVDIKSEFKEYVAHFSAVDTALETVMKTKPGIIEHHGPSPTSVKSRE